MHTLPHFNIIITDKKSLSEKIFYKIHVEEIYKNDKHNITKTQEDDIQCLENLIDQCVIKQYNDKTIDGIDINCFEITEQTWEKTKHVKTTSSSICKIKLRPSVIAVKDCKVNIINPLIKEAMKINNDYQTTVHTISNCSRMQLIKFIKKNGLNIKTNMRSKGNIIIDVNAQLEMIHKLKFKELINIYQTSLAQQMQIQIQLKIQMQSTMSM